MTRHQTGVAFAVATLGIACFSVMDALMKGLVMSLGAYNALFWRFLLLTVISGSLYMALRTPWPSRQAMRIHLVRGVLNSAMAFLFFWGLGRVPLAQGVALSFIAPLIALYLAALILKEKVARMAVMGSLLGFAGVLVILAGQAEAELGPEALHGALAILASAFLYAWNIILMRQQAQVAKPVEIAFFVSIITSSCFLLAAPFLAVVPPAGSWTDLAAAAGLAFVSLLFLSWAYARAQAQHLAPVEYTAFIWAALLGFIIFAEPVRPLTFFGAAMIVAGCMIAVPRAYPAAKMEAGL
jgi:S-adenosylmethionine uptake transporter